MKWEQIVWWHWAHDFFAWAGGNCWKCVVCHSSSIVSSHSVWLICLIPVFKVTGERIVAHNLKEWLPCRGVMCECFCTLVTEQRTPVWFETTPRKHAVATCHCYPSQCGFSFRLSLSLSIYYILTYTIAVNLSEARETALLESTYTHILTRVYLNHPQLMDLRQFISKITRLLI